MSIEDFIGGGPDKAGEQCVVCGKSVEGGRGYARIKHGERMVALCCPLCLESFQKAPQDYLRQQETANELRAIYKALRPKNS